MSQPPRAFALFDIETLVSNLIKSRLWLGRHPVMHVALTGCCHPGTAKLHPVTVIVAHELAVTQPSHFFLLSFFFFFFYICYEGIIVF
jgi:hypothetical protein